jgi:uncharacterized protein
MPVDPTRLGTVESVSGAQISVALEPTAASGLTYVGGQGYRAGQVGNLVRVGIGLLNLYGVIAQIGAGAVPKALVQDQPHGHRWMTVQLIGEALPGASFQRGLSEYPTIGDPVFLLADADLLHLYGEPDELRLLRLGQLAGGSSVPARVNLDRLITRHAAVVGATGSGKSSTVARLLSRLVDAHRYPSSRVLLFDLHGEYASALRDHATVFSAASSLAPRREHLYIPFWALPLELLVALTMGSVDDKQLGALGEMILSLKREAVTAGNFPGVDPDALTADSPVPFSLKRLWFELHRLEHATYTATGPIAQTDATQALEIGSDGEPVQMGSIEKVVPPRYQPQQNQQIYLSQHGRQLRRQVDLLGQRLRDPRYAFLLRPGPFEPTEDGRVERDLDALLVSWLGGDRPLVILELTAVPNAVLNTLVGAIVNISYEALVWGRGLPEGGRERPLLMVFEEAHAYLAEDDDGIAGEQVRRLIREGRKYGVGALVVSQRPSELDATVLSQCGTLIALRLANSNDRQQITGTSSDNFEGLFANLPILRTGEALVLGEAVSIPMRIQVDRLDDNARPDSHDPEVIATPPLPGGWTRPRPDQPDYAGIVAAWRSQDARGIGTKEIPTMERIPVVSSSLAAVGYDASSSTLEVEFNNGGVYQYYGVPDAVHEGLMSAGSHGEYFAANIRNSYPYAKL